MMYAIKISGASSIPMKVSSARRWAILAIVSSAVFLILVDMTVLHTALPTLTRDLRASASEKLWIINTYSLVVAGLLPGCGTLGDRVGHKRMLVVGLCLFGLASLAAAYSPSPLALIGARALLAVGAASMMPATLSIIRLSFRDEKECALAIGLWSAVASGGSAIGPLIGGGLLAYFWWGSVFLVNVPIVVAALVAALAFIPSDAGRAETSWDLEGSLLILIALVALAYAIEQVATQAASLRAAAIAAALGAGALAWFAWRQRRSATPLIDFSLFCNPGFTIAVLTALVSAFCIVGIALVLSQRLQLVLGLSPLHAALFMLPSSAMAFVGGPLAGWLIPRWGIDRVVTGALLVGGGGLVGLFLSAHAGAVPQLLCLAAFGLGVGASIAAASDAIMNHASADRAGMAASIEEVSIELGGAIGVTVLGSVLAGVYALALVLPENAGFPPAVRTGIDQALVVARTLPADVARPFILSVHQAFDSAYFTALAIAAALLFVLAVVGWRASAAGRAT
jgi:DHA2 family multidrug resistance protein-like MFS transporter